MGFINVLLTTFLILAPTLYLVIVFIALRKELRQNLLPICLLVALSAVFLNKLLFSSQTLSQKDFNNIQVPMMQFFSTSIKSYFLSPIWNNSFSGGFDAFESPLSPYFSVFNWVFLIGDSVYRSFGYFIFFQISLGAVFSYLLVREFQFKKSSALLGAILFTFNGFVVMRLSQGVGIEYLYTYKWIPLVLLATKKYLDEPKIGWFLTLAISLSMLFEGNMNIVVSTWVMWGIYLMVEFKKSFKLIPKLFLLVLFALSIYSIKLFPFFDLLSAGDSRLTRDVGGWRQGNIDWDMFPRILFPIQFGYNNAIFTPGLVGMIFVLLGLLLSLVLLYKNKKSPFVGSTFALSSLIFAFLSTIENPFYFFLYKLPVFNKVTQIPTFLIFYILPIVFFGSFFAEKLLTMIEKIKYLSKFRLISVAFSLLLPIFVFTEVLIGPTTFGNKTFSFNFGKMDIGETYDFPHYQLLKKQPKGLFILPDNENNYIFFYPYGITQNNLLTLNGYHYYFGSLSGKDLSSADLGEIIKRSDYIISMNPMADNPELELIDKVSMSKIKDYRSGTILEIRQNYMELYESGWNDDLYIYRVKCRTDCAIKNYSQNPITFSVELNKNESRTVIPTSIAYSKWFDVRYLGQKVEFQKDAYGYIQINLPKDGVGNVPDAVRVLTFTYFNPFIYLGFLISLSMFVTIMYYSLSIFLASQRQSFDY